MPRSASKSASRAASTKIRTETDSFGPIEVIADRYWGAQTERSRQNFRIGHDRMPMPIVRALGTVKLAQLQPTAVRAYMNKKLAAGLAKLGGDFPGFQLVVKGAQRGDFLL